MISFPRKRIVQDIETKEIEHRQIDKQTVDDQNATFCSFCFVVTWGPGQEDEAEVEQEITVVKVIILSKLNVLQIVCLTIFLDRFFNDVLLQFLF